MRFPYAAVFLAAVLLAATPASAYDARIGTITSTGASANNQGTGTPFSIVALAQAKVPLAIQCDAAVWVAYGLDGAQATATANDEKLQADNIYDVPVLASLYSIAIIPVVSGTVNCKVFAVRGPQS